MGNQQLDKGQQWLEQLLALMGLPLGVKTQVSPISAAKENEHWLILDSSNLKEDQKELLLANKAEGLDSIQSLLNIIINMGISPEQQTAFTIEIDGYRQKRQTEILELAKSLVEQVRQDKKDVEMKNLSASERKQVHSLLEKIEDITTESIGQEPDRRLVIKAG
jgi:spoIIIJ-associated protein